MPTATRPVRPVGRPRTRPDGARLDSYIGMKAPRSVRDRLEREGAVSGRGMSGDGLARIVASFSRDDHLVEALVLAYGAVPAAIIMIAAKVMARAGRSAAAWHGATGSASEAEAWADDPAFYTEAQAAADEVLGAFAPGESEPPPTLIFGVAGSEGRAIAREYLNAIRYPSADSAIESWAGPLRKLLGENVVARMRIGPRGMSGKGDIGVRFVTREHERRLKAPVPKQKRARRRREPGSESEQ
jgi:hypothetical protein